MNTNNTVASAAVALVNAANQSKVEARGADMVRAILERNAAKAQTLTRIGDLQADLAKISADVISPETVGINLPTDEAAMNPNQKTIKNVITILNKAKQDEIQTKSSALVRAITNNQNDVKVIDKNIAELQAKLQELTAEVVTSEQVTTTPAAI